MKGLRQSVDLAVRWHNSRLSWHCPDLSKSPDKIVVFLSMNRLVKVNGQDSQHFCQPVARFVKIIDNTLGEICRWPDVSVTILLMATCVKVVA